MGSRAGQRRGQDCEGILAESGSYQVTSLLPGVASRHCPRRPTSQRMDTKSVVGRVRPPGAAQRDYRSRRCLRFAVMHELIGVRSFMQRLPRASRARSLRSERDTRQPTVLRENAFVTNA